MNSTDNRLCMCDVNHLVESIIDELAPMPSVNQGHDYVSPTIITIRGIIREAINRYQKALEAAND